MALSENRLHHGTAIPVVNHPPDTGVSKKRGTPKSSILMGYSILDHPAIGIAPHLPTLSWPDFHRLPLPEAKRDAGLPAKPAKDSVIMSIFESINPCQNQL